MGTVTKTLPIARPTLNCVENNDLFHTCVTHGAPRKLGKWPTASLFIEIKRYMINRMCVKYFL